MATFRAEHLIECSEKTYWEKVFFDGDYNRRLFNDELHFHEWRELSLEDTGDRVRRVVKAIPPVRDLPGPLKAVIGEGAGYEEEGIYERATNRYQSSIVTNTLADRVKVSILTLTKPDGDSRCHRIAEGTVTAKIMMVGGMLEQKMVADLLRSYDKSAAFTNLFVREKGLT
jgi:hypothetical protein